MDQVLEVKNLTKDYGTFHLNQVSFQLPPGSIMGFIGENGAGKTTTIKLILDTINRDSGEITIFGEPLNRNNNSIKEHIGVVLDESSFPENVHANDINRIMKNCYRTWDSQKYSEFLMRFSLPQTKRVKEFSRGMKMKLAISVALSHDSRLLILDEATSGLDPMVREEMLDIFMDFIQDENKSILLSSHIISDLEKICDYITYIHNGEVLFSEDKNDLLDRFVILKCSDQELANVDPQAIVGVRRNRFGTEALALRDKVGGLYLQDPATIENIMLYYGRGDTK